MSKVFLIPNVLSEGTQKEVVSPQILEAIKILDYFLVENIRTARRFVASLKVKPVEPLIFEKLDKDTKPQDLDELMKPILQGRAVGIISEAGCPAIADPGSLAVSWAHKKGIEVIPLVGPSSILLALMASGMNGQSFEFHGYLPIPSTDRAKKLKELEQGSKAQGKTQIFMETPYRNQALLEGILKTLQDHTLLCIACNLTAPDQTVRTKSIKSWKKSTPDLNKKPTIFLIQNQ